MNKFSRAMSSRLMSSALLAVIIGSLCFSVGEGLRLTPFPAIPENAQTVVKATDKISLFQYGPLDVPAQAQKRSKRQALDLAAPESASAHKLLISFCYLLNYEAVDTGSLPFVPRPEGRAPPFLS